MDNSLFKRKMFWLKDFLTGAKLWKQYKYVSYVLTNPDESRERRRSELKDLLQYAKKNTVFYSEVKGDNLFDFPVINKQTITSRNADFIVDRNKVPGQIGDFHTQRTSGSTGVPFSFIQDTECRTRRVATIKAVNELVGFHSFQPLLHFRSLSHYYSWGGSIDLLWKPELGILYVDNSRFTDDRLERIADEIISKGILYIRGYVTSIDILTEYLVRKQIEIPQTITVIAGGETVRETLRSRIVDKLKWKIVAQYANEENGLLGQSEINAPAEEYKLYLANCFVEILKIDSDMPADINETGRIVVTDYTNKVMPFIRYEIGDLAMAASRTDDGEVTSIKGLVGRETAFIYRTDGSQIDLFNSISSEIFNNPQIYQWQFIQTDRIEYSLILCGEEEILRPQVDHFVGLIKPLLGDDAIIKVEIVSSIPVLSSGKRKIVVQQYKK